MTQWFSVFFNRKPALDNNTHCTRAPKAKHCRLCLVLTLLCCCMLETQFLQLRHWTVLTLVLPCLADQTDPVLLSNFPQWLPTQDQFPWLLIHRLWRSTHSVGLSEWTPLLPETKESTTVSYFCLLIYISLVFRSVSSHLWFISKLLFHYSFEASFYSFHSLFKDIVRCVYQCHCVASWCSNLLTSNQVKIRRTHA